MAIDHKDPPASGVAPSIPDNTPVWGRGRNRRLVDTDVKQTRDGVFAPSHVPDVQAGGEVVIRTAGGRAIDVATMLAAGR